MAREDTTPAFTRAEAAEEGLAASEYDDLAQLEAIEWLKDLKVSLDGTHQKRDGSTDQCDPLNAHLQGKCNLLGFQSVFKPYPLSHRRHSQRQPQRVQQ